MINIFQRVYVTNTTWPWTLNTVCTLHALGRLQAGFRLDGLATSPAAGQFMELVYAVVCTKKLFSVPKIGIYKDRFDTI